jgi:homoserine kinase type II
VFRQGRVVLVTDFGFVNRRPRVDDLALTLYYTLCDLDAAAHPDPSAPLGSLVSDFDHGNVRPLSYLERQAIPVAIDRQPLWSNGLWSVQLDDDDAIVAHVQGHEATLNRALNILEQLDHWREAFRRPST